MAKSNLQVMTNQSVRKPAKSSRPNQHVYADATTGLAIANLDIDIFADGADKDGMLQMYEKSYIRGFTTNPTLMRKAGIADYKAFAADIIKAIPDRPISFEVFSDDFAE